MNRIDLKHLASYDEDFALWAAEQAALLRAGKLDRVDLENVAEEVESLGKSLEAEIESRMTVLLAHMLKWQFQPDHRSNSWKATLLEQRSRINKLIGNNPSLKYYPEKTIPDEYPLARLRASGETGLDESVFPAICPYAIGDILDPNYFPGSVPA
jgi:hypothetical protein